MKVVGGTAAASSMALAGCTGGGGNGGGGDDYDLSDMDICTSTPPDTNLSNFMDYFAEECDSRSDGEISMTTFYNNELGAPSAQFQNVQRGTQFGFVYAWPTWTVGGAPDKIHGLVLPYQYIGGADAYNAKMDDLYWNPPDMMGELNEEIAESTNMRFVESGAAMLGKRGMTANSALEERSDFEGKKMRSAEGPMYTAIVEGLGGTNVQVPTEETPQQLQTGQLDINMWPIELLYLTEVYSFHDYIHVTNQYIQDVPIAASQDAWEAMTDSQKELVENAAKAASEQQLEELISTEEEYLDTMADEGLTVLRGGGEDIDEQPWAEAVEAKVESDLPEAWSLIQDHQNAV
jgi:TRAP-type C4-dicarboxylate transport system substrate-binding protein